MRPSSAHDTLDSSQAHIWREAEMLIEGIHHLTTLTADLDRTTVPPENAVSRAGGPAVASAGPSR